MNTDRIDRNWKFKQSQRCKVANTKKRSRNVLQTLTMNMRALHLIHFVNSKLTQYCLSNALRRMSAADGMIINEINNEINK